MNTNHLRVDFYTGRFLTITLLICTQLFSACSPEPTNPIPTPTARAGEGETQETPQHEITDEPEKVFTYSVIRVPRGERLIIRQPAGQSGTEVGTFEWNEKNVRVTGNRTLLGSSLWLEVEFGADGLGWVNALNITESVAVDDFCSDQRVIDLLNSFRAAIELKDVQQLSSLINHNRGLSVRLTWYSPEIHYSFEEVTELFTVAEEVEWGILADSGLTVVGTFEEIILPKIEDVFLRSPEATCNALKYGSTAGTILWPEELSNMKFYGVYRSSTVDGNEFDWRSWAVGIEYAGGKPFIATLIHYTSEL